MEIDIKTIALFYFIANAMNNGLIFIIWQMYRRHYRGLSYLLADMCLQTAGSFFLLIRSAIPDPISIIFTNLFSISGLLFILKGLELFFDVRKRRLYNYGIFAIYMLFIAYFTFVTDNLLIRNIGLSFIIIVFNGQSSLILFRELVPEYRKIARFVASILCAYCVFSFVRIIALILTPELSNDFFASGIVNAIALISYSVLNIMIAAGFIMMVSQRVLNEVETEKDKYTKAFQSSPYALLLTKVTDGKIFEVNEGFTMTTGYLPEEVIGKTTIELGLWVDPNERREFVQDLMIGDVRDKQMNFRMKSGEIRTGLLYAKTISAFGEDCIITSVSDITEMDRIRSKLEVIALHDTLTGLPNRQLFYDRAAVALANAKRDKLGLAVISLDVDRLKYINDHFGHLAGDQALITVGRRLFNLLRKGDTVARFGGDEFVILLNRINRVEDVSYTLGRIVENLSEPFDFEGEAIEVTASIGIAMFPNDDQEIDELIRKSDEAMYLIKENGRNGYRFYSDIGKRFY